jgi:biotin carboxyl carrier protein
MPCKVLSVLKKDGDQVSVGETVLVIESMKMETSVTSAVDGAFHTSVSEGDAVDDAKVLCWFD